MISNFSSLIEFFGALYLTMALENKFFDKIWNTKDFGTVIAKIAEDIGEDAVSALQNSTLELNEKLLNVTHKKGGFMLANSILLLIFIGFESEDSSLSFYLPLIFNCFFSFFIILFSDKLCTKWKAIVGYIVLEIIFFICLSNLDYNNLLSFVRIDKILRFKIVFFLSLLIAPIIHHLFVNWMFHGVYTGYMKNEIQNTMSSYSEACSDAIENHKEDEEALLTTLNDTLREKFTKIASPSIFKLTVSFFCHYWFLIRQKISETIKPKRKKSSVDDFMKN